MLDWESDAFKCRTRQVTLMTVTSHNIIEASAERYYSVENLLRNVLITLSVALTNTTTTNARRNT